MAKPLTLSEIAARWYLRMREHAHNQRANERDAFDQWLADDPRHSAEYDSIARAMRQLDSTEGLSSLAQAAEQHTFLTSETRRKAKQRRLAHLMVVCFIGLAGFFSHQQYQVWQAAPVMQLAAQNPVGQIVTRTLDDGSKVTLSARSDMEITYYRHQRHVLLKEGEAIFEVTKDPERPFVVETHQAKVTVLGSRFAVNQLSLQVRISVDHGRVQVARTDGAEHTLILRNGEVAEIEQMNAPRKVNRNAADSFSFISGRIVFDRADMFEVADTLSRYRNPTVQALFFGNQTPRVSAVLNVAELESFIQNLPQSVPVTLKRTHEALVIEPNR